MENRVDEVRDEIIQTKDAVKILDKHFRDMKNDMTHDSLLKVLEEHRKIQEKYNLIKQNKPTKEIQNEILKKDELHCIEIKHMQVMVILTYL